VDLLIGGAIAAPFLERGSMACHGAPLRRGGPARLDALGSHDGSPGPGRSCKANPGRSHSQVSSPRLLVLIRAQAQGLLPVAIITVLVVVGWPCSTS
jgi:hypothetical protein